MSEPRATSLSYGDSDEFSRRCSMGCVTWPDEEAYATCPVCGDTTKRYKGLHPISSEEAKRMRLRLEFERHYERDHEPQLELTEDEERRWGDEYVERVRAEAEAAQPKDE